MPTSNPPASPSYIWQHRAWPQLSFDAAALAPALDQARLEQGRLLGLLGAIGLEQANAVQRDLWVQEALALYSGVSWSSRYVLRCQVGLDITVRYSAV